MSRIVGRTGQALSAGSRPSSEEGHPTMSDEPPSPQNLLAQMEQMLAALNADLVQRDADLQPPAAHGEETRGDESFTWGADRV